IRWLRVVDDGSGEREKHKARLKVALTAQHRLHELVETGQIPVEFAQKLKHHYASRVRLHSARHEGREDKAQEELTAQFSQLQQDLITVELEALIRLRNQGVINDEVLREVQRDLDFEWLRLQGG
ncbi:MAG: hypothetical protein J2P36_36445, partial [Ktedonobacteraceae bacterium]|nr:hypothetical protein [Ktedonobacteraceae bacterium]